MAKSKFIKGEEVEVTIPDEGFRGSWFSATVIRPESKKKKIHVQYHNLLQEEGKTTKLKEDVESYNVRPLPPRETNHIFKLYEEVDAYHDDGWWEGDITRVVEEEGIEKFVVYFRVSQEERKFESSELRIHREWLNGSWDPPMADELQGTLSNLGADQNKESSNLVISKGKRSKSEADQTNESSKLTMNLRKSTRSKSRADQHHQTNEPPKSVEDQAIETSKLVLKTNMGTTSKSGTDQKESNEAVVNLSKGTPSMSGADKTKESPKPAVKLTKEMSSKSGTDQNKVASESVANLSKGTPSMSGAEKTKESPKPAVKLTKEMPSKSGTNHNKVASESVANLSKGTPSMSGAEKTKESPKPAVKLTKEMPSKSGTNHNKVASESVVNLSKGTPSMSGGDKTKESPKTAVKPTKEMSSKSGTDQNKVASESVVKFNNGAAVEISSDEKGFVGAWYVGTVVETIGANKFLVEHKNLKTDDLTEFLKEEVDSLHIRPAPPEILKDRFKKLEKVDAMYLDGWWTGVISKVDNGPQPEYHVYFKNTEEEIPFKHHQLRPHQEWIRGEWVIPSEDL